MRRRRRLAVLLLMTLTVIASLPAGGQHPAIGIAVKGGKWLLGELLSYGLEKGIDRALGLDQRKKLEEVEAALREEMKREAGNTEKLKAELELVRSQLGILEVLLNGQPSAEEVNGYQRKLAADLKKVLGIQEEQGERITILEKELKGLLHRVESLENGRDQRETLPNPFREEPRLRSKDHLPKGVTLDLRVSGRQNTVFLRERSIKSQADIGQFRLLDQRERFFFWLLQGTGAVIFLEGQDNVVEVPARLCGRVRVISRGQGNHVRGCQTRTR